MNRYCVMFLYVIRPEDITIGVFRGWVRREANSVVCPNVIREVHEKVALSTGLAAGRWGRKILVSSASRSCNAISVKLRKRTLRTY